MAIRARARWAASGCSVGDELGGLGLDHDAGHVMGDDVVQLAGDGEAFLMADLLSLLELTGVEHPQVPAGGDNGRPAAPRTAGT